MTISRPIILEFGVKVLGLAPSDIANTPVFDMQFEEEETGGDEICKARILAYAVGTWTGYATAVRGFLSFCATRELNPFECTPSVINLYMLFEAKNRKSVSFFEKFLNAWSFISKFFLCQDFTKDPVVADVRRFVEKLCPRNCNKKLPFGADEVRLVWDAIDKKMGGVQNLDKLDFRTFMLAVFQHKTFCRFSDAKNIRLEDVFHNVDYFKIHVRFSKTDQGGKGQWLYLDKHSSHYRDPHMLMCLYVHHLELDKHVPSPHMYLFPPLH